MKWLPFFTNFEGRITRKTFWLASIAVFVIEIVIVAIAAGAVEEFSNEAAGDLTMDIGVFAFLYPQFVISLKRGHDRDIPTWVVGAWYVVLAIFDGLRFAGQIRPNQSVFSAANLFVLVFIMFIGIIALAFFIELGFRRGTLGPNRFGPDPLAKS